MTTAPQAPAPEHAEAQAGTSLRLTPDAARRDIRARPTNKRGQYVETDEFVKMVRRLLRAAGLRAQVGDPETLALVAQLAQTLRDIETGSAVALNEQGFSWADIGRAQGVTDVTAYQKYALGQAARGASRKGAPTTLWKDIHAATGLKAKTRKRPGGQRVFTITDPGDATFPGAAEKLAAWLAENGWTVTGSAGREVYAEDKP